MLHTQHMHNAPGGDIAWEASTGTTVELLLCRRYLSLLRAGVDPEQHGGSVYFSYGGDITLTQQRYDAVRADPKNASRPAWQRADPAFFWNRHLAQPLLGV